MAITGHCLCKAVTYSIDVDKPNAVAYDHCDDCQRYTGSTYGTFPPWCYPSSLLTPVLALFAIFPKDKVTIVGPTKSFVIKGGSGLKVYRTFCPTCGSGVAQAPDAAPDIIAMNGGGLDREFKKKLEPVSILTSPGAVLEAKSWTIRTPSSGRPRSFLSVMRIWLTPLSACPLRNKRCPTSCTGNAVERL
jgi:hypothetical protein